MGVRRMRLWLGLGLAVVVAVGLFWFQPWKLWVDHRVDEALPVSVAATPPASTTVTVPPARTSSSAPTSTGAESTTPPSVTPSATSTSGGAVASPPPSTPAPAPPPSAVPVPPASSDPAPAEPVVLRSGTLISHEHETTGTVAVVALPDGSRVLTLENLVTSDGPDVRVWLSAAPVVPGEAGWYLFDDPPHVDLRAMKGNLGNQVYPIPDDVNLDAFGAVSLWCQRFSVSFGAAELAV